MGKQRKREGARKKERRKEEALVVLLKLVQIGLDILPPTAAPSSA
jgi:hypothetical protein